jgi:predicted phosphohydrolase
MKHTMKFQIASDIHLEVLEMDTGFHEDDDETFRFIIEPEAPILVLAGDITSLHAKCTVRFLTWCSQTFEHTFWIMGNHEYYSKIVIPKNTILEHYRRLSPENVHILDNETYALENILFVGTTLWSNIPEEDELEIQQSINDYRMIYNAEGRRICAAEVRAEFIKNVQFLEETIAANPEKQIVIISHHAPLKKDTSFAKYEGDVTNSAYSTDIHLKNDSNVRYWIYGHTHHNSRIQKGNYTVLSNQMGYFGEHTGITYEFSGILEV